MATTLKTNRTLIQPLLKQQHNSNDTYSYRN